MMTNHIWRQAPRPEGAGATAKREGDHSGPSSTSSGRRHFKLTVLPGTRILLLGVLVFAANNSQAQGLSVSSHGIRFQQPQLPFPSLGLEFRGKFKLTHIASCDSHSIHSVDPGILAAPDSTMSATLKIFRPDNSVDPSMARDPNALGVKVPERTWSMGSSQGIECDRILDRRARGLNG